jgi:hypothetical protein
MTTSRASAIPVHQSIQSFSTEYAENQPFFASSALNGLAPSR